MKQIGLRVIKLGGSLLEFDELPAALNRWLVAQPPATNLLIVGGGRLADQIRSYDRRFKLGDESAHQLAVRTMSVNAHFLSKLIGATIVTSLDEVKNAAGEMLVLDPIRLLLNDERSLPRNWNATSDSIAARIAQLAQAAELVLLKSVLPNGCRDWGSAAADGFVDGHFPNMAAGLSTIRCVNLRDPQMPQWRPAN